MSNIDIKKYLPEGGYEGAFKKDPNRDYQNIFRKYDVVIHDNCIGNILDLISTGKEYEEDTFIIPDYQRDLVWNDEQKENLIRSILVENPIGSFVFVRRYNRGDNGLVRENIYSLLDGQQRYNAIMDFLDNKFQVDGKFFKDLRPLDAYHFCTFTNFGSMVIINPTRKMEFDFYLTLNFGGTAHSKEDMEKFLKAKDVEEMAQKPQNDAKNIKSINNLGIR